MLFIRVKFDEVFDFFCFNVQYDGVVDFDERVRVTDGAVIMCGDVGNVFGGYINFTNTVQFVLKYIFLFLNIFFRYIYVLFQDFMFMFLFYCL